MEEIDLKPVFDLWHEDQEPKIGDLVQIRLGIEDSEIPEDRIGLIISKDDQELYTVQLSNKKKLQFNSYWLIMVNKADE